MEKVTVDYGAGIVRGPERFLKNNLEMPLGFGWKMQFVNTSDVQSVNNGGKTADDGYLTYVDARTLQDMRLARQHCS